MSQCMHDGRSGPCERLAAPARFYCKRHMPKAKRVKKKPRACPACCLPFVWDGGFLVSACDASCLTCARCTTVYLPGDPAAPTVAASDDLATKHDPNDYGACAPCWAKVTETGSWGRVPCTSRLPGAGEGERFPCLLGRGHKGHHESASVRATK